MLITDSVFDSDTLTHNPFLEKSRVINQKQLAFSIAAILVLATVLSAPNNNDIAAAQAPDIVQQRMYAFDAIEKQHEIPLKVVYYSNNVAKNVADFQIKLENVIQLYPADDLVIVGFEIRFISVFL